MVEKKDRERIIVAVLACLTLGLAPFVPEPHIIGKIKWVIGGAEGMETMDRLDLAMHGAPWIYLMVAVVIPIRKAVMKTRERDVEEGKEGARGDV